MAKCGVTNIGGGSGIGSDEISVAKDNVLSGKTYVGADTNDEIGTGTMANNGATGNQSLNAGSSFLVKKGYHAQDFSVGANSLANQTPGNAGPGAILTGYNAWVNGNKVPGSIPIQGADVSGTDRAWSTNISCWEGMACLGVRNAHYLNGVNWIQGNIPNFYAGNIKKGVNMGGIVGTFEGYVPTATDLYLRGNNIAGWTRLNTGFTFDTGQITIIQQYTPGIRADFSTVGFNYLNIQGYSDYTPSDMTYRYVKLYNGSSGFYVGEIHPAAGIGNYTISFNIANAQAYANYQLTFASMMGAVFRIWLS